MSKNPRGAQRSREIMILKTAQKLKSYPKSAQKSHKNHSSEVHKTLETV